MLYIIGILIAVGIIICLFEWLFAVIVSALPIIIVIAILIILIKFGLWPYALAVAAVGIVGGIIISLIKNAGKYVGDQVAQHDRMKKETAQIYQKTQEDQQMHTNDKALMDELSKNCYWLGYMSDAMWLKKLPNYANKQYTSSFKTITRNFAKQIEQQHILQNDDWFEPFKLYILNHPGGATVTKMLHEVNCPQLKMTHSTPDGDLLNTRLVKGTKSANKDVPALFSATFIKEMNESVFTPTKYLKSLYGDHDSEPQEVKHVTEISFDDL